MKIIKVKYLNNYKISVVYADYSEHVFDFEQTINDFVTKYDKFHEMLDTEYFKNVKLNKEWNTIEWDNGFDVCPDLLQPQYAIAK